MYIIFTSGILIILFLLFIFQRNNLEIEIITNKDNGIENLVKLNKVESFDI